ncbi:DUF354 domain-containing protein [Psychroflexus aestuariivivens]|uniref:DUF354 domain-containing protein n=1 Tax=Psychroflexus aestuariivivens TaxID=1795040 RepID=UPI000FDA800C|nr:DUF354 domain-containing protein [Psychroflexus aestuariivivens]
MKVLFHLGHPAHFHLFKNVISSLTSNGHDVLVAIKKKDVLEDLVISAGIKYKNILPAGRKDGKINVAFGQLKQSVKLYLVARKFKPELLIGTSVSISHVGKTLNIPSLNFNEDDANVVPLYARLAYPGATHIITPNICSVGKWDMKKIGYEGYHELAYLHPSNFTASREIACKYVDINQPYFIIRFAKLTAHHDDGITGITKNIAIKLINYLLEYGNVYITSERVLEQSLEKYRLPVAPKDMHHVMNYASIYIGDSQTMAAESGVLGVPFIRINDFVGRINYLKELEEKYELGFGFKPEDSIKAVEKVEELLNTENLKEIFNIRKQNMLSDKIDVAKFITWLIVNYPKSTSLIQSNPELFNNFK